MPPSPEVLLSGRLRISYQEPDLPDEGLYSFLAPKPPATEPLLNYGVELADHSVRPVYSLSGVVFHRGMIG